ncbi:MAG: D-alanyl-D-alanine carboxypeptidase/D-alanyl-D-alanine-endopeptidase [Pseudomonadota bacterium]
MDDKVKAPPALVIPVEPAASAVKVTVDDVTEASDPLGPIKKQVEDDERFYRPLLSIGDDVVNTKPDLLPDGADVSYVVVDLDRGTIITEHQAGVNHIPASSAKLATAVMALQLLGPEHRFRTELLATGPIEDGVLKGDLILKGGGDPLLDIPDLLPLISDLARWPLRSIEGRFLIDDSLLPRLTEIEPTQPTEAAYNPSIGALSLTFNRVNLRWDSRKTLSVETVPHLDEALFEERAKDRLPPGGVQLKQIDDGKAVWQLADRGARRSKRSLPVKDAGLYAGRVFADLAELHGIHLPPPERTARSPEGHLLAVHEGRPLRELVRDMLWYSNNLVAELIGLAAAKTVEPELPSLEASADVILGELEKRLPDVSWDQARLDNHSGLSSRSQLTPEQLAAILRYGWKNDMLADLLPASGWSGTLTRRFNDQDQAFRIWAKTGSMNYVTTLGGYMLSSSHGPAAFVIMISDAKARAIYDGLPRRTRAAEKKANVWKANAEKAMNEIVERWLETPVARPLEGLYAQTQAGQERVR